MRVFAIVVVVEYDEPVEGKIEEKPNCYHRQDSGGSMCLSRKLKRLGYEVKKCYCYNRPCTKAQDKMQLVAQRKREEATEHGGPKRSNRYEQHKHV